MRNRIAALVFTAVALAAPLSASAAPRPAALPQLAAAAFPLPVPQYLGAITITNGSTNTVQFTNSNPGNPLAAPTLLQATNGLNRTAGGGGTVSDEAGT